MSPDDLKSWIKRRDLSHRDAAALLALSIDGLRQNLYGRRPINPQTARIVDLSERLAAAGIITGSETAD